jgi:hypothetical protein
MRTTSKCHSVFAFASVVFIFSMAVSAATQKELVIHSFPGVPDGQYPTGGMVFDAAGNLYGATSEGGASGCGFGGCGAVFELSPQTGGGWVEQIVYDFPGGSGGAQPEGNLLMDSAGNLYGTTDAGGSGHGIVYELIHNSDGSWTSNVLYSFSGGSDGSNPYVGLVLDKAGNLYGTTQYGGDLSCGFGGCGVVFELSPTSGGTWIETVIHTFEGTDGELPQTPLVFDAAGNLYGAAAEGGTTNSNCSAGCGLVFRLTPAPSESWQQTILYSFSGSDGSGPVGNLAFDFSGNLYGVTVGGGDFTQCQNSGCGFVFELSPASAGWTLTREFGFNGTTSGANPLAGVALGGSGHVFGSTYWGGDVHCTTGGTPRGCGLAFELSPTLTSWTEKILHVFGTGNDGINPGSSLVLDRKGHLYGTTVFGGGPAFGIAFEIAP